MGKIDKKRKKIKERIEMLENEMKLSLTKKASDTAEINLASHQKKIQELRKQLSEL